MLSFKKGVLQISYENNPDYSGFLTGWRRVGFKIWEGCLISMCHRVSSVDRHNSAGAALHASSASQGPACARVAGCST
eukprot:scaffold79090_cov16-Tisochrysis_lutea.AAC.1